MASQPLGARMLGRYELLFMLGQGGMGEVHLAKLTGAAGFEKLCIVKTILPQMQEDPQFVDRFHHEARTLVHLTHSNIAQVYDMGDTDGTLYMAIEYVPGVDLARVQSRVRSKKTVMPVPIALYLAQQVCEALGYAHRKTGPDGAPLGIVHRDISPQNVMVSYEGEVKVIDFGLAKSAARSKHTLPSTVLGKLGYMAPEQAMALPVDHRGDIYSAGIVVWELLAGRPLFSGGTLPEMVAKMGNPTIPALRSVREDITTSVDQAVLRALAKDPAARYNRADDFARALNEIAVREGLTVGAEEVGNYVRAMCPDEFAAERKLQSQLSVMRKRVGAPDRNAESRTERIDDTHMKRPEPSGLEGTMLRPSQPGEPMTPAQRALSTVEPSSGGAQGRGRTMVAPAGMRPGPQEAPQGRGRTVVQQHSGKESPASQELVVPRSKAPMVVVGVLALAGLGAGGFFLVRGNEQAVAKVDAPRPPGKIQPLEPAKAPEPMVDAGKEVAAAVPDAGAPVADVPGKARERVKVQGAVYRVLAKGKDYKVLLAFGQKLSPGEGLVLVGDALAGTTERERYGSAAVDSVDGQRADLLVDAEGELPEKLFAVKDASHKPKVHAAAKTDKPDRTVKPPDKGEEAVKPDKAEGQTLPDKKPPEATPDAAPAARAQLSVVMKMDRTPPPQISISNTGSASLTSCEIRSPPNASYRFPKGSALAPGTVTRVPYATFLPNDPRQPDPRVLQGVTLLNCREGFAYQALR